jgi:SAM-dependent methyltransferase
MSNDDHTSVGLQSWGSSILLADRFCQKPDNFSLTPPSQGRSLRILELGAGTGLLSIVAAKILQPFTAEIVATDYHPDVLENLAKNVVNNFTTPSTFSAGHEAIVVTALDWEHPEYSGPLAQSFDIILAADVIYHPSHAEWIKPCVEKLLSRPSGANDNGGVFWLIIAVRTTGRHAGVDETVEFLFPNVASIAPLGGSGMKPQLVVLYREVLGRHANFGRADEIAYKLFKIGWAN